MRLSVVLCTYNGEPYLQQLLDSIVRQERRPDELVVGDDGSTDGTLAVLRRFVIGAPFQVRILEQPVRLGVNANFAETLTKTEGDVIALCDQDDIWLPQKLAELEREFSRSPGLGAAFSDAELVGANGASLGRKLWSELKFDDTAQAQMVGGRAWEVLLKRNVVTGATLAVSADVVRCAVPFPPYGLHDVWLGWVAALVGIILPVPRPLVLYRQHPGNLVGAPRRRVRHRLAGRLTRGDVSGAEALHLRALVERIRDLEIPVDEASLRLIEDKIAHLWIRAGLPKRRLARVAPVATEVWRRRYARYGRGWQSIAFDLLFRP